MTATPNYSDPAITTITCDVSICYLYAHAASSQSVCSFWTVRKDAQSDAVRMDRYYARDVAVLGDANETHSSAPSACSWHRVFEDISARGNAKVLVVAQTVENGRGSAIHGRVVTYGNYSLDNGPAEHVADDGGGAQSGSDGSVCAAA